MSRTDTSESLIWYMWREAIENATRVVHNARKTIHTIIEKSRVISAEARICYYVHDEKAFVALQGEVACFAYVMHRKSTA